MVRLSCSSKNYEFKRKCGPIVHENLPVFSRQVVAAFYVRFKNTHKIGASHGEGRRPGLGVEHFHFIDSELEKNTELTAFDLQKKRDKCGVLCSRQTVRVGQTLGWTFNGTRYCQLISQKNRGELLKFALKCLKRKDNFQDVIFVDETKIQMDCHVPGECSSTKILHKRQNTKILHEYSLRKFFKKRIF